MLRTYRDQAIVLRSYKLGEADRIVLMLGKKSGQIRAVAKGVRRTTSRFGARLSPFNLVDIQLHSGRNLDTVTQVETISAYSDSLTSDYPEFTNAKLIVETAQKLTEGREEPTPEQFELLHGALHALAGSARPATLVGTAYLLRSMALEGWKPTLTSCVSCGQSGDLRFFSSGGGGAFCTSCAPTDGMPMEPGTATLMEALIQANWDGAVAEPTQLWEQARDLAGAWGQWHLETRLRSLPFATAGAAS
ncbi:MAG: DNA repair protein RecO [Scrofimicrobium sp.]